MRESDERDFPAPGTVLDGAYQLVRLLSEGGMARVYEAIQLRLQRRVAVKVLSGELADSPEALARFRREVKVTSQLAHPHVVQLLDFGTIGDARPYLVTEFLEGEDLERRLDRVQRMPLADALGLLRQIGSALVAVHARGIVHRDLKPANVLLLDVEGAPDFVKVIDFGISKIARSDTRLTGPSSVLGTPDYMSPEQASGRAAEVDHRTDQWALACIAWAMLVGRPPFCGPAVPGDPAVAVTDFAREGRPRAGAPRGAQMSELDAVLGRIVNDDPPALAALAPELPRALEAVFRRALAKQPAKRFPTVTAFLRAFEGAAAEEGGRA